MGVTQLWQILSPVQQHKALAELEGLTLAVDLSIWVCETQGVRQMQGVVSKPFLRNLFFRISHLTQLGVKLVFVIEGTAPELKWEVMMKRQQSRFPGRQGKPLAQRPAGKQTRRNFNSFLKECCELLDILGLPYIQSRGEAEAMCALLNKAGLVDGCLTNDGDAFLYGAEIVYRNFTMNSKDPHVEMYRLSDLKSQLSLDRDGLIALGLLLGCDFVPGGVPGIGLANGVKLLHTLAGRNVLQRIQEWRTMKEEDCLDQIEVLARRKALAVPDFPQTKVINEFKIVKDRCPSQLPPWRRPVPTKLQDFLLVKLEWPPEYSLDKVLPLVTLWDMQDILRSVNPSRHQHLKPHRIVKTRVRQGVQCYEVEWHKPVTDTSAESNFYITVESQEMFSKCFPDIVDNYTIKSLETKKKSKSKNKKKKKQVDVAANLENLSFHFDKMNLNQLTNKLQRSVNDLHPSFTDYDESNYTPKLRQSKVHSSNATSGIESSTSASFRSKTSPVSSSDLTSGLAAQEQNLLRVKPLKTLDENFFSDSVRKATTVKKVGKENGSSSIPSLLVDGSGNDQEDGNPDDEYMPLMQRMKLRMKGKGCETEVGKPGDRKVNANISSSFWKPGMDLDEYNKLNHFAKVGSPLSNTNSHYPSAFATPKVGVHNGIDKPSLGMFEASPTVNVTPCQCGAKMNSSQFRETNDCLGTSQHTKHRTDSSNLLRTSAGNNRRLSDIKYTNSPLLHSASATPISRTSSTPIREGVELDCMSTSGFGDFNIQNSLLTSLCSSLIQALTPKGISKDEYQNLVTSFQKMNMSSSNTNDVERAKVSDKKNEVVCNIDFEEVARASETLQRPLVNKVSNIKPIVLDKTNSKDFKVQEPVKMTRTAKEKLRKQQKLERMNLEKEKAKLNASNHAHNIYTPPSKTVSQNNINQNINKKNKREKSNLSVNGEINRNSLSNKQTSNGSAHGIEWNGQNSAVKRNVNSKNDECKNERQSKKNTSQEIQNKFEDKTEKQIISSNASMESDRKLPSVRDFGKQNDEVRKIGLSNTKKNNACHDSTSVLSNQNERSVNITDGSVSSQTSSMSNQAGSSLSDNLGKAKKKKRKKKVKKSVADFDLSKDESFLDESKRKVCVDFLKKAIESEKLAASQQKCGKRLMAEDESPDNTLLELDVISGALTGLGAAEDAKARLKKKQILEAMQKSNLAKSASSHSVVSDNEEKVRESKFVSTDKENNAAEIGRKDQNIKDICVNNTSRESVISESTCPVDIKSNAKAKQSIDHKKNVFKEPQKKEERSEVKDKVDKPNDLTLNESAVRAIEERAWKLIEERILAQAKKMVSTCGTQTLTEDDSIEHNDGSQTVDIGDESKLSHDEDELSQAIVDSIDLGQMRELAQFFLPGPNVAVNGPIKSCKRTSIEVGHQSERVGANESSGTDVASDTVAFAVANHSFAGIDKQVSAEVKFPGNNGFVESRSKSVSGAEEADNQGAIGNDNVARVNGSDKSSNRKDFGNLQTMQDLSRLDSESFMDNSLDVSCQFNSALKQHMEDGIAVDNSSSQIEETKKNRNGEIENDDFEYGISESDLESEKREDKHNCFMENGIVQQAVAIEQEKEETAMASADDPNSVDHLKGERRNTIDLEGEFLQEGGFIREGGFFHEEEQLHVNVLRNGVHYRLEQSHASEDNNNKALDLERENKVSEPFDLASVHSGNESLRDETEAANLEDVIIIDESGMENEDENSPSDQMVNMRNGNGCFYKENCKEEANGKMSDDLENELEANIRLEIKTNDDHPDTEKSTSNFSNGFNKLNGESEMVKTNRKVEYRKGKLLRNGNTLTLHAGRLESMVADDNNVLKGPDEANDSVNDLRKVKGGDTQVEALADISEYVKEVLDCVEMEEVIKEKVKEKAVKVSKAFEKNGDVREEVEELSNEMIDSEAAVGRDQPVAESPICLADRLKLRLRKSTTRNVLDTFLSGLN